MILFFEKRSSAQVQRLWSSKGWKSWPMHANLNILPRSLQERSQIERYSRQDFDSRILSNASVFDVLGTTYSFGVVGPSLTLYELFVVGIEEGDDSE